jgi:hypothetical protein
MFVETINGVIMEREIDNPVYEVERFNDRYDQEEVFKLW